MGPRAKRATVAVALALGIAAASEGCRAPTQVTLDITYGGLCEELGGVGFIIGTDPYTSESRIETNVFTTTTTDCTAGTPSRVGTLVVTPNDDSGRASIIVLAGFGKRVEDCKAKDGYFGCIVARRSFSFVEHASLTLEIPLDPDCKNVPCDAVSTCRKGACVDSNVACSEDGCATPGDVGDGGIATVDAPTTSDQYVQGDTQGPPLDAQADASHDGPHDAGADAPYCEMPDGPLACNTSAGVKTCATGERCCAAFEPFTDAGDGGPGGTQYKCRATCAGGDFQNPNVTCTSARQCAAGMVCCSNNVAMPGGGTYCAAQCSNMFDAGLGTQLCEDACECRAGGTCAQRGFQMGQAQAQTLKSCGP